MAESFNCRYDRNRSATGPDSSQFRLRKPIVIAVLAAGPLLNLLDGRVASAAEAGVYQDDPVTVKTLQALANNTSALLPAVTLAGKEIEKWRGEFKSGPYRRDFGNKMVYAPDRGTGMYCGANHGAPHRFNDAWEYHLGSNTWHLLFAPDGGDHATMYQARAATKGEKASMSRDDGIAFMKKWYRDIAVLKDGYFQTKKGGPVEPWHTWSGLTYDPQVKRMIWATLNDDESEIEGLKEYAEVTGQAFEKLKKQLKPGTSLWLFDPKAARWERQLSDGPRPKTRAQGGFLEYVPDLKQSIWYTADWYDNSGMWAYDAVANRWKNLQPNGGISIYFNNQPDSPGKDIFPPQEMQVAYSSKHRKIVAVLGDGTWIYDLDKNAWSKKHNDARISARDSRTVFAYDSINDVFLLLDPSPDATTLFAYSIESNKWERLDPRGAGLVSGRGAGYYDPKYNVLVVYLNQNRMWVYRYKKSA